MYKNLIPISIIVIIIVGVIIAGVFIFTNQGEVKDEPLTSLAKCLSEKGVKFYGTHWCGFCAQQKEMFGDAAIHLPYIECASDRATPEELAVCQEVGVGAIPDWRFPDGRQELGMLSLEKIAELSGCQF